MEKVLKRMHPAGLLAYFLAGFLVVIWSRHPWITAIQTQVLLGVYLYHERSINKILPFLFLAALVAVTNPIFVQRGVTVLFTIGTMRITLESLLYGVHYGFLLMNVVLLCTIMNRYFRSEHWAYLTGSAFPKLGMTISMVMRLLPKYRKQGKLIMETQSAIRKDSLLVRLLKTFAIETSWAFETSMDQVDSMAARGYGIKKKRTHFHLFCFRKRDAVCLVELVIVFLVNLYGWTKYYSRFFFYPMILWKPMRLKDIFFVGMMALQLLLPVFWKEAADVSD